MPAFSVLDANVEMMSPVPLILFFTVDYALTVVVSMLEKRPSMLVYGVLFPFIRLLDAALFWRALFISFSFDRMVAGSVPSDTGPSDLVQPDLPGQCKGVDQ